MSLIWIKGKAAVPWQLKVSAKIALSRLPISYKVWKRLGLFEFGPMQDPDYANSVFQRHYQAGPPPVHCTALELGPGDSLFSALAGFHSGMGRTYLVDAGDFAGRKLDDYRQMALYLGGQELVDKLRWDTIDGLMTSCRSSYLTKGVSSLGQIPSASVDFIYSQSVLQHVRKDDFTRTLAEMRRILSPNGFCSHLVDLRDLIGGALNNLRFSRRTWESDLFRNSGFYTNRIRFGEMLRLFDEAGFSFEIISRRQWASLPTPRAKMDEEFRNLPEDDLLVSGFWIRSRPRVQ